MLEQYLKKHFGYDSFRTGQKEVIEAVIAKRDTVALLPTGSGKSICYQLPAYVLEGSVLVISPLLSLMEDQVEQLKKNGEKNVIAINSFLTGSQRNRVFANLSNYRFIFVSPEMFSSTIFQNAIQDVTVSLIAVDEAHCISQWGFDFRPEYLQIGEFLHKENRPPILALTATATEQVIADIQRYLGMNDAKKWISPVDRTNIAYQIIQIQNHAEKNNWIVQHVVETVGPGIVYTKSRKKTMEIAALLKEQNIRAEAYHAGMESQDRQLIQHQYIAGELDWIISTNAFGMGVHKPDIRQIIHDHLPSNTASYVQEVGRAGRDGHQSFATLLYSPEDEQFTKSVVTMDYPNEYQMEQYDHFRMQAMNPNQMITEQIISETSFRILDYWMRRYPIEEVKSNIQKMQLEKINEVELLKNSLLGEQCIRDGLNRYFGQKTENRPELCCSKCGLPDQFIPNHPKELIKTTDELSWRDRITHLFRMK